MPEQLFRESDFDVHRLVEKEQSLESSRHLLFDLKRDVFAREWQSGIQVLREWKQRLSQGADDQRRRYNDPFYSVAYAMRLLAPDWATDEVLALDETVSEVMKKDIHETEYRNSLDPTAPLTELVRIVRCQRKLFPGRQTFNVDWLIENLERELVVLDEELTPGDYYMYETLLPLAVSAAELFPEKFVEILRTKSRWNSVENYLHYLRGTEILPADPNNHHNRLIAYENLVVCLRSYAAVNTIRPDVLKPILDISHMTDLRSSFDTLRDQFILGKDNLFTCLSNLATIAAKEVRFTPEGMSLTLNDNTATDQHNSIPTQRKY